jgi:hypothetical protein
MSDPKIFAEWEHRGVRHYVVVTHSEDGDVILEVIGPYLARAILSPKEAREIADGLRAEADDAESTDDADFDNA